MLREREHDADGTPESSMLPRSTGAGPLTIWCHAARDISRRLSIWHVVPFGCAKRIMKVQADPSDRKIARRRRAERSLWTFVVLTTRVIVLFVVRSSQGLLECVIFPESTFC